MQCATMKYEIIKKPIVQERERERERERVEFNLLKSAHYY